jgi:autotransporter passenger strand-loop-strand repeat protein
VTKYFAPQGVIIRGLTLNAGDVLNVDGGRTEVTTINSGGIENVLSGKSIYTTINSGGIEAVGPDGLTEKTSINSGGLEFVAGESIDTRINPGGVESVFFGGMARSVIFVGDPSSGQLAKLELSTPSEAKVLFNFGAGDAIDFFKTTVTSFHLTGDTLTVMYHGDRTASYELRGGSRDFHLQRDGNGGTELVGLPHEAAGLHV